MKEKSNITKINFKLFNFYIKKAKTSEMSFK